MINALLGGAILSAVVGAIAVGAAIRLIVVILSDVEQRHPRDEE